MPTTGAQEIDDSLISCPNTDEEDIRRVIAAVVRSAEVASDDLVPIDILDIVLP